MFPLLHSEHQHWHLETGEEGGGEEGEGEEGGGEGGEGGEGGATTDVHVVERKLIYLPT